MNPEHLRHGVGTTVERNAFVPESAPWYWYDSTLNALYYWDGAAWSMMSEVNWERVVVVAKSGGDFTVIQDAIDSILDAAANKRYCVLICPGDYAETIVGSDYVELMGLAAREAANITGATGPLYTFPDNEGHIFNLKFSLSPTTANQEILDVPATVAARQVVSNCLFVWSTASDINTRMFDVNGGEIEFINNKILLSNTNVVGGAIRTQTLWDIDGNAIVDLYGNIVDVDIYDVNDRVLVFDDASLLGGEIHIKENVIRVNSHNAGAYSGIVRFITYRGVTATLHVAHNFVELTSAEAGGTGTADFLRVNSAGTALIRSTANHVIVQGFATNRWANIVGAADIVISHFDNIVAVDGWAGAGTAIYASSFSNGAISTTGDVVVGNNLGVQTNNPVTDFQVGDEFAAGFGPVPSGMTDGRFWAGLETSSAAGRRLVGCFLGEQTASTTGSLQVLESYAYTSHAAGVVALALGNITVMEHEGAGTLTDGRGQYANVLVTGTGDITNARAFYGLVQLLGGSSGDITNGYGLYIETADAGAGEITTMYGVYIEALDGVTNYGIYQVGASDLNHFAGYTSIGGTVTPLAALHVDNPGTDAQPVLYLDQGDVSEEMIEFNTTIGVGNAIEAVGAKTLTVTHFIKVTLPGALTRYFEVGTIA
jgi:hypothetical protein